MERSLYLTKFRNLGFNGDCSNHSDKLVLNHSLKKGEMGNLVIVIGANNSGKSNVLDALSIFNSQNITSRDVTTLYHDNNMRKPQLSLCCKDEKDEYVYRITLGETPYVTYPNSHIKPTLSSEDLLSLSNELNQFKKYCSHYNYYGDFNTYVNQCDTILNILSEKNPNINDVISRTKLLMREFISHSNSSYYRDVWNSFKNYKSNSLLYKYSQDSPNDIDLINQAYKAKYDMPFIPQIVEYKEEPITNQTLNCSPNNINNNKFFISVLNKIGISVDEIINAYKDYNTLNDRGILTTLQEEINSKISIISNDFNKLYFADEDNYNFKITIETGSIFFEISRSHKSLSLDYQSTGFKWFFNLYFNLLCKTTLNAGDIIVMDEPATNLHVEGQTQLRAFLKTFAMENDLTIVLATHSPFLIDINYLDEIRVVSNKDNLSYIHNDFTAIDKDDPDSLKPVKNALTIHSNILLDPDKILVFVEGITDYNYLLAFRKKLGLDDNIVFLPIKGVGDTTKKGYKDIQLNISKELIKFRKYNSILLVDGDGAGKSMQAVNKDSELSVITLTDINKDFKEIENLFDETDTKKYHILEKSSMNSALIKTFVNKLKFSETTKNNFKQVFDKLLDL